MVIAMTLVPQSDFASNGGLDLKIFIKDVQDATGRKRPLTLRHWSTVKDVKDMLSKQLHIPPSSQLLYFGNGNGIDGILKRRELPNRWTLMDAGIYRSGETVLLEIKGAHLSPCSNISALHTLANDVCVSSEVLDLTPKSLQRLVQQARRGMALGFKPILAPDGSGGSYFLTDTRKAHVGVFKPSDEEPFAENNPRGYVPDPAGENNCLRKGIRPGDSCLREVAAFLLDKDGFSSVPMTTLAECRHPVLHVNGAQWNLTIGGAAVGVHSLHQTSPKPESNDVDGDSTTKKVGSFQEYIQAECCMDDISPSKISVEEVHKIAILDIRIMNADRNVANILCQRIPEDPDHFRLLPIDHGYSLRSVCDVAWFDWCWLDWPQLKEPMSKKSKDYVMNLDIEADARLLRERLDFGDDVLDHFRASCNVLKAGVKAGLTLYDIASKILCRTDSCGEVPSKLETLTSMASELATLAVYNGRFHHATASLALAEQLSTNHQQHSLPSFAKSTPIVKSKSSFLFSNLTSVGGSDESVCTDELYQTGSDLNHFSPYNIPHMAQSSISDCGSSVAEELPHSTSHLEHSGTGAEEEDAEMEKWAAALIAVADESLDKDMTLLDRDRNRSLSTCSYNTDCSGKLTSSSSVGFWHVRPGSSAHDDDDDVSGSDGDLNWMPSFTSSNHPSAILCDVATSGVELPHILRASEFSSSNLSKLLQQSPSRISCLGFDDGEEEVNNEFSATPPVQLVGSLPFLPKTTNKTMTKSMSFSAFSSNTNNSEGFSSNNASSRLPVMIHGSQSLAQDPNHYQTYLRKFVDLLVIREIDRLRNRDMMPKMSS